MKKGVIKEKAEGGWWIHLPIEIEETLEGEIYTLIEYKIGANMRGKREGERIKSFQFKAEAEEHLEYITESRVRAFWISDETCWWEDKVA
jgi:hypothetical protein